MFTVQCLNQKWVVLGPCAVYIAKFRASGQGSTEIPSLWAQSLHIYTKIFRASGQGLKFRASMKDTASDRLVTWPQTATLNVKGKFGSHQSAQKSQLLIVVNITCTVDSWARKIISNPHIWGNVPFNHVLNLWTASINDYTYLDVHLAFSVFLAWFFFSASHRSVACKFCVGNTVVVNMWLCKCVWTRNLQA